ncbi:MAG: hypothetical protein WA130_06430, partial [Candidatus Methanoperedens sp.]
NSIKFLVMNQLYLLIQRIKFTSRFIEMQVLTIHLQSFWRGYKNSDNEACVFDCIYEPKTESEIKQVESKALEKTSKKLDKTNDKTDITEKSKGIMESIFVQVTELLKQHPKLTYSEIIGEIPELHNKARPQNYLWNVIDRFGNDKIEYSNDRPTKLSLLSSKINVGKSKSKR